MRYRLIPSDWMEDKKIIESNDFTTDQLLEFNKKGYNIFYFPNHNSEKLDHRFLKGADVDVFSWIFVDMDLKDAVYKSKKEFIDVVKEFPLKPTKTINSGNGVHCFWKVDGLDRQTYIELQLRLINHFKTDDSIWTLQQLMRLEGFNNTKDKENFKSVVLAKNPDLTGDRIYKVEDFEILPELTDKDQQKITDHLNKVDGVAVNNYNNITVEELPEQFQKMLESSETLSECFYNPVDRSAADMKIANILQIAKFEKDEATNILLQTNKGQERGISYVSAIVEKVWDSPLDFLDDDYELLENAATNHNYIEEKRQENFAYKVLNENKKIQIAKRMDKMRGKFSIKDSAKQRMEKFVQDTKDDIEFGDKILPFVGPRLTESVALCPKDYVLIGGVSGRGKSTLVSNIALPILEAGKKVVIISTEETAFEIMKRTMALKLGYDYGGEKNWEEYKRMRVLQEYKKYINNFIIIDYLYETKDGVRSMVSTMEGIENVLEGLREEEPGVIIIDYLTKISTSITNPDLHSHTVIDNVAKIIEEFQKSAKIPIVAFCQLRAQKGDDKFQERIKGRQSIYDYVTTAAEVISDPESNTTTIKFDKVRKIPSGFQWSVELTYVNGKYIEI
jgi:archaellum biogenesis ATPase FlaH